ncbi:MAG: phosphotransferase [Clostridia bacterium]|nr:phosphotransferase [Clostridia bacterium]
MSVIHDELNKLGIVCDRFSILQDKDGVTVARIVSNEKSYVIKCFQKEEHKRELENYRLLASLGIPTIRVIASTDSALLLENITCSSTYRLGIEEDMFDSSVTRLIAVWYKQLHSQGYSYVSQHGESMYDEADFFTLENIVSIKEKTGTQDAPAWVLLEQNYAAINERLRKARRTLTYNDFYYTNMVVAKDKSSALMFDYNLLGRGYAYTDVRNVLSSLSAEAGKAFLDKYGEFDPVEKALDDVVSVVVALYLACQRDEFPWWAQALLDELDTTFIEKIECLQSML